MESDAEIKENEEALNVINEKLSSREKEIEVVLQNEYDSSTASLIEIVKGIRK